MKIVSWASSQNGELLAISLPRVRPWEGCSESGCLIIRFGCFVKLMLSGFLVGKKVRWKHVGGKAGSRRRGVRELTVRKKKFGLVLVVVLVPRIVLRVLKGIIISTKSTRHGSRWQRQWWIRWKLASNVVR